MFGSLFLIQHDTAYYCMMLIEVYHVSKNLHYIYFFRSVMLVVFKALCFTFYSQLQKLFSAECLAYCNFHSLHVELLDDIKWLLFVSVKSQIKSNHEKFHQINLVYVKCSLLVFLHPYTAITHTMYNLYLTLFFGGGMYLLGQFNNIFQ